MKAHQSQKRECRLSLFLKNGTPDTRSIRDITFSRLIAASPFQLSRKEACTLPFVVEVGTLFTKLF